jgi:hypothetical protein
MDYGKLCKEILDLDPKIRFAGVCDETFLCIFDADAISLKVIVV